MEFGQALRAIGALAHETRLSTFRTLVAAGPDGLPAGEIAGRLGVLANTMSNHLAQLSRAGLVRTRREGRTVRYAADPAAMRDLIAFLVTDCCDGRPEICGPIAELAAACAAARDTRDADPAPRRAAADGLPR